MLTNDVLLQNRYLIRGQVGQGSMGAIYRAVDLRLDTEVAVKQIVRRGRQMRRAFAQEAKLLAQLRHPALPKVIDHFSDEAGYFLVMEFISGDDLAKSSLKRLQPFAVEQVLDWGQQLLRLLAYLHGQRTPILHGDIKPHNLKLNERGEIVLLDFGLAQRPAVQPELVDAMTGYSRHYAPPEQRQGQNVDARSDLYALAATLYDLATGVKPPDAVQQRLAALAAEQPDPLQPAHEVEPSIPAAVAAVWQQALALNPQERYASAHDMHLALETAIAQQAAVPHNLPAQVTPLVGRRREVGTARRRFLAEGVRLLTLTGPGGVGKTRLGLQIAAALRDEFVDGVFFVPLATLRDPDLVLSTMAHTLGVKESGRKSLREDVQERLRNKQTLLLLDNFEHLLDAALLVTELLATCPQLKVLVTSREVLHVRGEHEFPVSPLEIPDRGRQPTTAEALQYTAVQLFVQRARAAAPGFVLDDENVTAVADICAHLDGLPLAIELAAARVKTLTPAQILDRLTHRFDLLRDGPRDLPARQQALRATLDWSYELLAPAEKALFRRLAVFAGGWTAVAAEAVCQPGEDDGLEALPLTIADGLASLVDKSLVQREAGAGDEPRYAMLVTVQAYAAERLAENGEADAYRQRHADYYSQLAETARAELIGPAPEIWLEQLGVEHDNMRATLSWAVTQRQAELGLTLGIMLSEFWKAKSYFTEGRQWLVTLLESGGEVSPTLRATVCNEIGVMAAEQSDYSQAFAWYQRALTLRRQLGDRQGLVATLNNLGIVAMDTGDYEQATDLFSESLAMARKANLQYAIGHLLNNSGLVASYQGNFDQAAATFAQSHDLFREIGDKRSIALSLINCGEVAQQQGNYHQASDFYEEALTLVQAIGDKKRIALAIINLGSMALAQGEYVQALQLLEEGLSLAEEVEHQQGIGRCLDLLGCVALYQGRYEPAAIRFEKSLSIFESLDDRRVATVASKHLGDVARYQRDNQRALVFYEKALGLALSLESKPGIALALDGLGLIAQQLGKIEEAQVHIQKGLAIWHEIGAKPGIALTLYHLGKMASCEQAVDYYVRSLLLFQELNHKREMTGCLEGLAGAALMKQKPEHAGRLLGTASALRATIGAPLPPVDHPNHEHMLTAVRAALEEDAFATAWAEGQAMSLEKAVTYALEE